MNHSLSHTQRRFRRYWGLSFTIGILFMLAGAGMILLPFKAYYILSVIFSITFIINGITEITMGILVEEFLESRSWRIAGGVTDLFIGVIIYPELSIHGLAYLLAISLIFRSIMMMGLSFSLRLYNGVSWMWLFMISILSLIFSFLVIWDPNIMEFSIATFTGMAFWGIGLFMLMFSFRLKRIEIPG
ncbi:DUF308 domain-containing protein [Chitinophaga sancti]|uniref:HdeD family acid-resistance protein n=1 Tax=Chitinophaga sancti TaxID=1004 RepID=UPI002A74A353|nr:DUF308 domain-containing protein [Chitinophaga sancti]WPQ60461.1 DUF308 domain-containing protein [Chitinophaga sancti]